MTLCLLSYMHLGGALPPSLPQLWVSTNLGTSWVRLGQNVTRYSWRVLSSELEDNTTVYYEQPMNGETGH